jgi:NADH:ubiquinone oxidoreductase subunit K
LIRPRIDVVYGFSPGLEVRYTIFIDSMSHHFGQYILYLAFGTVAVVDCSIAAAMCVILYKCSSGIVTGIAR